MNHRLATSDAVATAFGARAKRATVLARASPRAKEILRFVADLCEEQRRVAAELERRHREREFTGSLETDAERLLDLLPAIARFAARAGPAALAALARGLADEPPETTRTRLVACWVGGRTAAESYLARAQLRPYLELLRVATLLPDRPHARGRCPFCGGFPSLSCRRGASESDGAARFLFCASCGLEWSFGRILCPSCFEADPRKLPAFTDRAHPNAAIEACETCRRYVKSIDLSADARLVPEIDELESLALDLWAAEQGFERTEIGAAGI